jgi:hypothetical protein
LGWLIFEILFNCHSIPISPEIFRSPITTVTRRVQILKDKFSQSLGLPFQELLPSSVIGQALKELKIRYKQRLFDPMVTLWAFLSQVLDTDKTCHNAVSKIIAY